MRRAGVVFARPRSRVRRLWVFSGLLRDPFRHTERRSAPRRQVHRTLLIATSRTGAAASQAVTTTLCVMSRRGVTLVTAAGNRVTARALLAAVLPVAVRDPRARAGRPTRSARCPVSRRHRSSRSAVLPRTGRNGHLYLTTVGGRGRARATRGPNLFEALRAVVRLARLGASRNQVICPPDPEQQDGRAAETRPR